MTTLALLTPADHLDAPLRVGAPDVAGALAVFPVFGPPPRLDYAAFADAHRAGVIVRELEAGASVNDVLVVNMTGRCVLLYEGEEVTGARQDRTFDVSVLVGPGTKATVPVSCVEAGRWDAGRHDEPFAPAPHAAYPALRRMKSAQVRTRLALGQQARAMQSLVWDEVADRHGRLGAPSVTGALGEIFDHCRDDVEGLASAIEARVGQSGALVALGGQLDVLDYVSRPDVFRTLHPALVRGYAIDALDAPASPPPSVDEAQEWLDAVSATPAGGRDAIGLGRELRFERPRIAAGSGLVCREELIQLTAFAEQPARARHAIHRPARRRR